jgi:hypothetical protein
MRRRHWIAFANVGVRKVTLRRAFNHIDSDHKLTIATWKEFSDVRFEVNNYVWGYEAIGGQVSVRLIHRKGCNVQGIGFFQKSLSLFDDIRAAIFRKSPLRVSRISMACTSLKKVECFLRLKDFFDIVTIARKVSGICTGRGKPLGLRGAINIDF